MDVSQFIELFIKELETNRDLHNYYKLLQKDRRFLFRKAYIEQRLQYVNRHLERSGRSIWDAGCGYGTTALFACLNGHHVLGTTLEFYYDQVQQRLDYWSRYGDLSGLQIEYNDIFLANHEKQHFDTIILQDTLHHLEPVNRALELFHRSLKPDGKLIISEENGNNPYIILKNFAKRGFNRVKNVYDERLGKTIVFGNENARGLQCWEKLLNINGFYIDHKQIEYIRYFPPVLFHYTGYLDLIEKEHRIGKRNRLAKEFLFFGMNFTALKKPNNET
jgi:2-polyprenyl-3-methyl-5-hydroxy-6-metoxy-1,4-benzoquinol methylase